MSGRNKVYFQDGSTLDIDELNRLTFFNKTGSKLFSFDSTGKLVLYAGSAASGNIPFTATAPFSTALPFLMSVPAVATGQTAAKTNLINYTPPAVIGVYRLLAMVNVTAWTTPASFTIAVTYKDDQGNADTETLAVARGSTGAVAAAITAVDRWYAIPLLISTDNSQTAITLSTTGTFTGSPSYSFAGALERVL